MFWEQAIQCEAETDIGLRRKNNEDAFSIHVCSDEAEWRRSGHLLLVADGMGGHAVGELASRIAVEIVPHTFLKSAQEDPRARMHEALLAANQAIHSRGTQNADFLHMGTTCTALALCARGAYIGHIGDSRAYRIRRDRVDQLTFDHSLEWELERQQGSLLGVDLSQHKNILTRSLGPEAAIDADLEGPFPILPGDAFLLCSDGLSNLVNDAELGAIVRELPPRAAARLLIHLANIRGGPDNSTAVIARVGELPANIPLTALDVPVDRPGAMSWLGLAAFGVSTLMVAVGLTLLLFQYDIAGSILTALAVGSLIVLLAGTFRERRRPERGGGEESVTHFWRPHRTAVGLSSRELFELLLQTDADLERSAREDGWGVNWVEHQQLQDTARAAAREKRYSKGLRDLARAIALIMDELPRGSEKPASA